VKQEAEDLIGYKFGEGKVNWFRNIFDRLTGAPRQIATPAASAAPAPANLFSESSIAGD
jgi:hypothetical protein